MATVRDRLWIWGRYEGSHNDARNLQGASRMTPAEGASRREYVCVEVCPGGAASVPQAASRRAGPAEPRAPRGGRLDGARRSSPRDGAFDRTARTGRSP